MYAFIFIGNKMKKTILATVIAVASFNAAAAMDGKLPGIDPIGVAPIVEQPPMVDPINDLEPNRPIHGSPVFGIDPVPGIPATPVTPIGDQPIDDVIVDPIEVGVPNDGDLVPVEDVIVDPIKGEKPEPSELNNALEKMNEMADELRDTYTGEKARAYTETTEARLDNLEAGQMFLFNEVERLDSKIDGVAAMNQAALAARPYLSSDQTSSFGVGVGGSGSEGAVALGYAHRINANWTANANVAYNTGDSAEASYGAGVSYAW
jgi:uncharacterized protein YukE